MNAFVWTAWAMHIGWCVATADEPKPYCERGIVPGFVTKQDCEGSAAHFREEMRRLGVTSGAAAEGEAWCERTSLMDANEEE